ncbi:MAG: hypothetical protein WB607_30355 [Candidatus Acidiferrum sp.]|jgi:hypothetical protein
MMSSVLENPRVSSELNQQTAAALTTSKVVLQSLLQEIATSETADSAMDFEKIAETLARDTAIDGEKVVAAMVVVFSHATADDVFTGACESAIELDPASWIPELNMERKIPLSLLRDKGPAGVFAVELEKLRYQLSDRSLASRAELFFRHVKIRHSPMFGPADAQCFRQSKLVEADDLRNAILHERGLSQIDLDQSRRTMLFLHEAAMTAMRSLASAYRLPVEWNSLLGGVSEDQS